ncbi:hypothetical protein A5784_11200 [Mycobacterium sp. 852013-50091_SCH5140682]|uniref:DUF5642 family protein n=1 Tax=Mycobacterium sp. 852013-50091_SCH5140682 TaxID=1834109 RepID=UPI0007EC0696|nr:DUF5642 family protein [Mycobacterium sp. 852013-50091_SCH5140682]OBC05392.1 hypothetical protein A5784_11200 [Mycobacterium sp. 852013-50091_SCH5140682]
MPVRTVAAAAAVAWCAAACAGSPESSSPTSSTSVAAVTVNPVRIDRVRQALPPGYDVAPIDKRITPIALWGFGSQWTADPPQCSAWAAPAVDPATARGWSGSGPGGIVYAVVARTTAPPDLTLGEQCGEWGLRGGHSTGTVMTVAAPAIPDAVTTGMTTVISTVVEGGNETRLHADTFTADLGEFHCFVTIVTDPGSPVPPLGPEYAADLLVKTVSAIRG